MDSYFERDCVDISMACEDSPDMVAKAGIFTLLTIQQWLGLVPRAFHDVQKHGSDSRYAWGNKKAGVAYVLANQRELLRSVQNYHSTGDLNALIRDYMDIPGLGIVKASFMAQLTVADGACLDIHNLRHLGLSVESFKMSKTATPATYARRIGAYNAVWRDIGDSAHWWDLWCDSYAQRAQAKSPVKYANGSEVSRVHRVIIGDYDGPKKEMKLV